MTENQALEIIEAHEVLQTLGDAEETELLKSNNPDLLNAYHALLVDAGLRVEG